ncbi:MAG: glutamate--tRNA ligase [Thermoplasmatota archaeon]
MEEDILAFALQNALEHDGRASIGPVMGKVMAFFPELKNNPRSTSAIVRRIVEEVNSLSMDQQRERLTEIGGPIELGKRERKTGLPELKGAVPGNVVMRFAPGPSGPLHLGHTRAAILNDEYCRMYGGRFILRLEDTNPEKIDPSAYDMIPEDLEWLGVNVHETFVQSDRFDIYYDITKRLIEKGAAYVCTLDTEIWRELKLNGRPCGERYLPPDEQLGKWERMLEGGYSEGEASVVIKTNLGHKNPAVRDFVGMRIKDEPHPRTGDRYRVYPLYNLSVAIDDHLMGCTHILRGKDHLNNTLRQEYIYGHMDWSLPEFTHYGLVSIPDSILKTSIIREEIATGKYSGWSDVRLGTLQALAARGFDPRSLRDYWVETGIKSVDISFSWETLYAKNRSLIDAEARRFFFVPSPVRISFEHDEELHAKVPLHPERPELGFRTHVVRPEEGKIDLFIPGDDLEGSEPGSLLRLKDLCNIEMKGRDGRMFDFAGTDPGIVRGGKGRIVQWVGRNASPMIVHTPEGSVMEGLVEEGMENYAEDGDVVQFERIGYCRIFHDDGLRANLTHP